MNLLIIIDSLPQVCRPLHTFVAYVAFVFCLQLLRFIFAFFPYISRRFPVFLLLFSLNCFLRWWRAFHIGINCHWWFDMVVVSCDMHIATRYVTWMFHYLRSHSLFSSLFCSLFTVSCFSTSSGNTILTILKHLFYCNLFWDLF